MTRQPGPDEFAGFYEPQDDKRDARPPGEPIDAAPLPALTIVNAASFAGSNPPPREWHVPDLIPKYEITMLSGDGGTGKSLLALQLAVATAAGTEWVGSFPSSGRVLFVSAEDDIAELHRRLATIARAQHVEIAELDRLEFLPLAGKDAVIAAPVKRDGPLSPTRLFEAIRAEIEARRPDLLVLDTLADLFGGDEIKRPHARQFIGLLRGLALDFRMTIVLLSHPSQSGMASGAGTSGSTAWSNSVRSRLYFERPRGSDDNDDDADARVLTTKKANYGRIGNERVLRWREGVCPRRSRAPRQVGSRRRGRSCVPRDPRRLCALRAPGLGREVQHVRARAVRGASEREGPFGRPPQRRDATPVRRRPHPQRDQRAAVEAAPAHCRGAPAGLGKRSGGRPMGSLPTAFRPEF